MKSKAVHVCRSLGGLKTRSWLVALPDEVPNSCFATAVEEKRNKEGVELSGTI